MSRSRPATAAAPTLGAVAPGSAARLRQVGLAAATRLRLAELGLRPGSVVRVLNRTPGGGCVVGLGTSRVAVDRRTARLLTVEPVDTEPVDTGPVDTETVELRSVAGAGAR